MSAGLGESGLSLVFSPPPEPLKKFVLLIKTENVQ